MKKILSVLAAAMVLLGVLTGCGKPEEKREEKKSAAVLYLSDEDAMYVIGKEIDIAADNSDIEYKSKLITEKLIEEAANLKTTIPKNTKFLSAKLENNKLTLDMSKEFITEHIGGSTGFTMTFAPIVLSLTELDGIDEVWFTIEGKNVEDFKGTDTLNRAFTREEFLGYIK
jgi:spore germination protein GerM